MTNAGTIISYEGDIVWLEQPKTSLRKVLKKGTNPMSPLVIGQLNQELGRGARGSPAMQRDLPFAERRCSLKCSTSE